MPPVVEKQIMYDAPECARNVELVENGKVISVGYLSIDNYFYKEEHLARYQSCTHKVCDCGRIMVRGRTLCDVCSSAKQREKYFKAPEKEWDGKTYLTLFDDDRFFRDSDDLEEYCEEHEVSASDLMLVICEPNELNEVTSEYWEDIAPEDVDDFLPEEVEEALKNLNEVIKKAKPISWSAGKYRTRYEYIPESLTNQGGNVQESDTTDGDSKGEAK